MFRFLKRLGGDSVVPVKEFPMKNAEAFVRGTPVNLESGLACVGAPADSAFLGIANETVTASADGQMLEVIMALPDVVFEVNYTTGSKTTLANADIGTAFDLKSGDVDNIDLDDTTDGAWVVQGFNNTKATGYVTLLRAKAANILD